MKSSLSHKTHLMRPRTRIKAASVITGAALLFFSQVTAAYATPVIEMVRIKGGCYLMGDLNESGRSTESPVHEVCVDDFMLGKFEVTNTQWYGVMGKETPGAGWCGDCPVHNVSWDDSQKFIARINQVSGKKYRLPYEAEWEYAARSGGEVEAWAGTNSEAEATDYAWYLDNSGFQVHPVGKKKPNGLGLFDMSGNVWEWVNDWYDGQYYKASPRRNPTGPSKGDHRVMRGGGFALPLWNARTFSRDSGPPGLRYSGGVRLALPVK